MEEARKRYTIKAYYRTGDSFHSEDTSTTVGSWDDLNIAKENLIRIREHYSYYRYKDKYSTYEEEKKWKGTPLPDYIVTGKWEMISIKIKEDNGDEYTIYPAWCGYFETLYEAEIIVNPEFDDGMRISFR